MMHVTSFFIGILFTIIPVSIFSQNKPGGVTNARTWFKADNFTAGTTTWSNSVTNVNIPNLSTGGTSPTKNLNNVNYNPSISFLGTDDNDDFFRGSLTINDALSATQGTLFLVFTDDNLLTANQAYGYFCTSNNQEFTIQSKGVFHRSDSKTWLPLTIPASATNFGIFSSYYNTTDPDNAYLNDGANGSANFSNTGFSGSNGIFTIGDIPNGVTTTDFGGQITEALSFPTQLTAAEFTRVNSYLAIKYGITLDNSGGGTAGDYYPTTSPFSVWDASFPAGGAYHNDVIGLGRDDVEALLQKQSHTADDSLRIYLNTLQASNAANTGTFAVDESYVLIGHNQGKLCATPSSAAEKPAGIYSRLEREWKVTKTNFPGTFSLDITIDNCAASGTVNPADLRLLVDNVDGDGDFSDATIYAAGGGLSFSYSGGIITVSGISTTQIPNNTTKYITIASVDANTPLPVELLYFNAKAVSQNKVQLDWQTVTEINNDYFTVERSRDAVSWEDLLEVDGAGNSSVTLSYINFDNAPYRGTSYYRLKQTDFDGSSSKSQIVPVLIQGIDIVNVYPNPGAGEINLIINSTLSDIGNITIYDKIGKVVYQEKITLIKGINKVSRDVTFLVEGSYTIRASISNGKYFDHELYMVGSNN
ncbi:MAG: T9SS type A sorting domain-containing protein [Flavobacteriales bacterium]|nr:T9SS type A sorting domain-containing protein [Flavobacteriales bacterium]